MDIVCEGSAGSAAGNCQDLSGDRAQRGKWAVVGTEVAGRNDLGPEIASHVNLVAGEIKQEGIWGHRQTILIARRSLRSRYVVDRGTADGGRLAGASRAGGQNIGSGSRARHDSRDSGIRRKLSLGV